MSLRFTKTEKWDDPWFSELSMEEKLLFLYLIDNCNLAGFYEINYKKIELQVGLSKEKTNECMKGLARGVEGGCKGGGWVWIKNFIKNQKNLPLNSMNSAHVAIMRLLEEQVPIRFSYQQIGIVPEGGWKGASSPLGKGKGKGKGGVGDFPAPEKKGRDCTIGELTALLKIPANQRTVEQRNQISDASHFGTEEQFNLVSSWKC